MITQRIENNLAVRVKGADLTGATNLEFYVKQGVDLFIQLTPKIVRVSEGDTDLLVVVPYEEAMKLRQSECELQLAWTDANGQPCHTPARMMPVEKFLKEAGYDPS